MLTLEVNGRCDALGSPDPNGQFVSLPRIEQLRGSQIVRRAAASRYPRAAYVAGRQDRTVRPATPVKWIQVKTVRGHAYHYFRRGTTYIRLDGAPGSPEYHRHYASLVSADAIPTERHPSGSVGSVIAAYRASSEFRGLGERTRVSYNRSLDKLAVLAAFPVEEIRRAHIRKLRDKLANTPRTADLTIAVARLVFARAVADDMITSNPAAEFEKLAKSKSYKLWSDQDLGAFEAGYTAGRVPRWAMTAFLLALHVGQARAEVLAMGPQHRQGDDLVFRRRKTDADLRIALTPRLLAWINALPSDWTTYVAHADGSPMHEDTFSHKFRDVLDGIGLYDLVLHGIRHTAATDIADGGGSEREIRAITGHRTSASVEVYTRRAEQKKLAKSAQAKRRLTD
jgi:integrase